MVKIHSSYKMIFLLLNLLVSSHSYSNPTIKIEDFVKLPTHRDAKISPDGKYLSVILRKKRQDVIAILNIKTRKVLKAFRVKGAGRSVGDVYWTNNTRIVYDITENHSWNKGRYNTGELVGVNVDGSKHKPIFGYRSGGMQTGSHIYKKDSEYGDHEIIDLLKEDPEHILLSFYPWKLVGNYWVTNPLATPIIYKLNIYDGSTSNVDTLPLPKTTAITDNDGRVRFAVGINNKSEHIALYKNNKTDKWKKFSISNFSGKNINPISFTKDNQNVYLSAHENNGTKALYLYNLKDHSIKKLFQDKSVDISIFIRDFSGNRVIAVGTELALPKYYYLEKNNPKLNLHRMLIETFKGSNVVITSTTTDNSYAVVYVHSDINPGDYYLFDTKSLKAEHLLSRKNQINPKHMTVMDSVEFTTRDGTKIRGYLTKANGKSQNMPLVVLPHGGPHGVRDYWGYNWEIQLLASRGYAVLQVNYRGSSGFGLKFQQAGYGKWGTLMQDDITDATRSIINQGIADPERICIFGTSYGAYAALMGAAKEPSLYQCAIGSAGVYSLPMMFEKGDIIDTSAGLAYLKEVLGNNTEDQKARSPVFNVDKIKAEVLLIHGAKDKRAPLEQAESLKDAFDDIGKKYQWLKLKNEPHGYYDEANRLLVYKKILAFLDNNIGDKHSSKLKK